MKRPRPPVFVSPVLEEPGLVRALLEANAPFAPVQRYFASQAEYGAVGTTPSVVAPNFRGDFALGEPLVEGVEPLLFHEGFTEAAKKLLDAEIVRPDCVFANLTWQLPFPQGPGHTDIPAFRGVDRTDTPIWLLASMGHSRLFEDERVDIATAVAWFYRGRDGGFTFWPDGPGAPARVHEGDIWNTAFVGDNDFMFHRVNPVGDPARGLPRGLTLDTRLVRLEGDTWGLVEAGETLATFPYDELRISVSWKARVFRDARAAHRHDAHEDDLTHEAVVERLVGDLRARGVDCPWPDDPFRDEPFIEAIRAAYVQAPPEAP